MKVNPLVRMSKEAPNVNDSSRLVTSFGGRTSEGAADIGAENNSSSGSGDSDEDTSSSGDGGGASASEVKKIVKKLRQNVWMPEDDGLYAGKFELEATQESLLATNKKLDSVQTQLNDFEAYQEEQRATNAIKYRTIDEKLKAMDARVVDALEKLD